MRAARRSGCQLDCIDQRYVRTDAAVASPSLRHVITFLIAEFSRVNGERAFDMGLILLILIIVLRLVAEGIMAIAPVTMAAAIMAVGSASSC